MNAESSPESLFPASERVTYERNPLEQVICQVRFPTILRIDAEPPARFQDAVRAQYPLLKEIQAGGLPDELPADIRALVSRLSPVSAGTAFDFNSEDGLWTLSLNRDFLALTARDYRRWEDFKERLTQAIGALVTEYAPAFFSRIGLRYQNVISRADLGLGDEPWSELLQAHVLGELVDSRFAQAVDEATRELVLRLAPEGRLRIRHGLAIRVGTKEVCYLIDTDFFTDERTTLDDIYSKLGRFNGDARRLFRWCITQQLHEALGPVPI